MLPGLAPHHTRAGFLGGNRLRVEKHAPNTGDYAITSSGFWLLPPGLTTLEQGRGVEKLEKLAGVQAQEEMDLAEQTSRYAEILASSRVNATGCLVGGLAENEDPLTAALTLAEYEMRTFSLDSNKDLPFLRVCDDLSCYNPRHFDLSFGRPTLKEKKVELNPDWFRTLPSGRIKTLWDDVLPSVEQSLERFIRFQRLNFPFVANSMSRLTPGSASQVRFHPFSGCWEAWAYYCRPDGNLNWQFDGYGRLYQNTGIKKVDKETGEILSDNERGHRLAHRVVWAATPYRRLRPGYVLNHKCSHRRCCNPLHLEQVSLSVNTNHGVRVQAALRSAMAGNTGSAENFLTAEELVPYHSSVNEMYRRICEIQGLTT